MRAIHSHILVKKGAHHRDFSYTIPRVSVLLLTLFSTALCVSIVTNRHKFFSVHVCRCRMTTLLSSMSDYRRAPSPFSCVSSGSMCFDTRVLHLRVMLALFNATTYYKLASVPHTQLCAHRSSTSTGRCGTCSSRFLWTRSCSDRKSKVAALHAFQ